MILVRAVFFNAVLAGHLDHGLVGLRAGVLEEDLVHADGGADLLGQQRLGDGVGVVEGVHDVLHLVDDGCDDLLVAVAGGVHRDARVEIQVGGAVLVIDVLLPGRLRHKVEALVGLDHVLVDLVLDVLCRQSQILELHGSYLLFATCIIA